MCKRMEETHNQRVSKLGPSNKSRIRVADWEPQSKTLIQLESGRQIQFNCIFIHAYLILSRVQKIFAFLLVFASTWSSVFTFLLNIARVVVTVLCISVNFIFLCSFLSRKYLTHLHMRICSFTHARMYIPLARRGRSGENQAQ